MSFEAGIHVCPSPQCFFRPHAIFFATAQKLTRQIDVESHTSQMPSRKACMCGRKIARKYSLLGIVAGHRLPSLAAAGLHRPCPSLLLPPATATGGGWEGEEDMRELFNYW
jgi:hypothetical protein